MLIMTIERFSYLVPICCRFMDRKWGLKQPQREKENQSLVHWRQGTSVGHLKVSAGFCQECIDATEVLPNKLKTIRCRG